jgi:hypothetical protein
MEGYRRFGKGGELGWWCGVELVMTGLAIMICDGRGGSIAGVIDRLDRLTVCGAGGILNSYIGKRCGSNCIGM